MIRRKDLFDEDAFFEGLAVGFVITVVLITGLAFLLVRFEDMTPAYRHGHAAGYTAALDSLEEEAARLDLEPARQFNPDSLTYPDWVEVETAPPVTYFYEIPMDSTLRPHGGW